MVPVFKSEKTATLKKFIITVKTLEGLEEILASEINGIGGENIQIGKRVVYFEGDLAMVYRANYRLRTALRVFRQIDTFSFKDIDDFYIKCIKVKWDSYLNLNQTFAIQSTVFHSVTFKNSMYASLKVKDAVVDRFRQRTGDRPNIDTKQPDIIFHVHVNNEQCTLSIDSSGDSLHKRGYRQIHGDAPLNEVLAAGMILISGWKGETDFVDPMCGSGTLPIEAALIARNIPPGRYRKEFAFTMWKDFDEPLFEQIKSETEVIDFPGKIFASDISKKNILGAQTNARSARIFNLIEFRQSDVKELNLENFKGTMISNPPYGERLTSNNLEELYHTLGEKLKHHFTGNIAWILSSSVNLVHKIGLRPAKKVKLLNGALVCSFLKFELFEGKRKDLKVKKVIKKQS
jgi:putative N6-adenine-specific DNA methylase